MIDNPYRTAPGSEPPAMVGREQETSLAYYATGLTSQGGASTPIVFTGRRGMGKTALLRRCVAEAKKMGGVVLSAEASTTTSLPTLMRRSLETSKREFASLPDRIKGTIDAAIQAMPEATFELPEQMGGVKLKAHEHVKDHERFRDVIEDLNAAVRKKGRFLVFAIDEIQITHPESMQVLIEVIHQSAGTNQPILLMGAGLTNSASHLQDIRTYTERWRYASIDLLTREQTIEAIQKPAKALGVTFDARALAMLVEETSGYPFFVQEYASASWIAHKGARVTVEDVERIAPGVRKGLELGYYDRSFRTLSPRELRYVMTLAEIGPGPASVGEIAAKLGMRTIDASSTRNRLVTKDVLSVPWSGVVEFRMPLAEKYIERHLTEFQQRIERSGPSISL